MVPECYGRTDELRLIEMLRRIPKEPVSPARVQTLYTPVPTNPTATVLVLLSSPEFEIVR